MPSKLSKNLICEACDSDNETYIEESSSEERPSFETVCNKLDLFLKDRSNCKSDEANVLRVSQPPGRYYISNEEYETFLDIYADVISHPEFDFKKYQSNFGEKNCEIKPLLLDFDFNFKVINNTKNRIYYPLLDKINKSIYEVITNDFKIDNVISYVFEKSNMNIKQNNSNPNDIIYKDGIHIMVYHPFNSHQREYLYDQILKRFKEEELLNDIDNTNYELVNSLKDIFDNSTINRNCWMMYGSTKIDSGVIHPKYYLVRKYNNNKSINCKSVNKPENIIKYIKKFTIRTFEINGIDCSKVRDGKEFINEYEKTIQKKTKVINSSSISQSLSPDTTTEFSYYESEKINEAKMYLELIDKARSDNYDSWMKIGWALKSVHSSLYDEYIKFSKLSSKFDENACKKIWSEGRSGVGMCNMNTLKRYAMMDNEKEYLEVIKNKTNLYKNSLSGTHVDIAKYLIQKMLNYIVTGSKRNKVWYLFTKHRWVKNEACIDVIKIAQETAYEYLNDYNQLVKANDDAFNKDNAIILQKINNTINPETNNFVQQAAIIQKEQLAQFKAAQDALKNLQEQLKINNSKNLMNKGYLTVGNKLKYVTSIDDPILVQCANELHEQNKFGINITLREKLDSNINLIGFENGIYDTERHVFRIGTPEDYITMSVGYDYKEFSYDDEIVKKVYEYFDSIQPNKEVAKFLIKIIANCLKGKNDQQKFYIFYGGGKNGKSVLCESLLKKVFGDYFTTADPSLVTKGKNSSSTASPEIIALKGKRIVILNEPEQNEKLQLGIMKKITGGDEMQAREIMSNRIIHFIPQFTPFYLCNIKPEIESTDYGTWRRICEVGFKVQFVDQKVETLKENQKKGNSNIEKIISSTEFIQATMWVLIQELKEIQKNGIDEPNEVKNDTREYKMSSDYYERFLSENYERNSNENVLLKAMFADFKDFVKDEQITIKVDQPKFKNYLKNNGFEIIDEKRKPYVKGLKKIE